MLWYGSRLISKVFDRIPIVFCSVLDRISHPFLNDIPWLSHWIWELACQSLQWFWIIFGLVLHWFGKDCVGIFFGRVSLLSFRFPWYSVGPYVFCSAPPCFSNGHLFVNYWAPLFKTYVPFRFQLFFCWVACSCSFRFFLYTLLFYGFPFGYPLYFHGPPYPTHSS